MNLDLTNVKTIKSLLNEYRIRPSKYMGQNFLLSQRVVKIAVEAAELKKYDVVLEIGPGLGALTFELAKYVKKVVAVEKDKQLGELLKKNVETEKLKNIEIVNRDILKLTTNDLRLTTYKVVANLPYQITSPVLWKFLHEEKNKPQAMVLMVQKEVAERIVARPGKMSVLSVLVQYYADVKIIKNVGKGSFYPEPKVDSAIIRLKNINTKKHKNKEIDEKLLFELVKTGFSNKRKMLKNNITSLVKNRSANELLKQAKLNPKIRAQELSVEDWIKLHELVYNTSMNAGNSKF